MSSSLSSVDWVLSHCVHFTVRGFICVCVCVYSLKVVVVSEPLSLVYLPVSVLLYIIALMSVG